MTTKFLDNKFARSKFHCRAFPMKNSVFGRFSSLSPSPPPFKSENFIFIAVSPSLSVIWLRPTIVPVVPSQDFAFLTCVGTPSILVISLVELSHRLACRIFLATLGLSGLPNAKWQRSSYAISQIAPLPPVVALNRSCKSQIAARYAAFWHAISQIALASFL